MGAVAENAVGSEDKFIGRQSQAPAEAETENQRDVRNLVDFLSKLNPSVKEFVPSSHTAWKFDGRLLAGAPIFVVASDYYSKGWIGHGGITDSSSDGSSNNQLNPGVMGWRRKNDRVQSAQSEESIRRTVYVSDIDHHVTEESLLEYFLPVGNLVEYLNCANRKDIMQSEDEKEMVSRTMYCMNIDKEVGRTLLMLLPAFCK
ncbi:hypothetical protein B296_00037230 [Ensete ventricosum]|uniref:RRM domain-containing protein n=1 Tax=Ensete ventricosum TaxID=4639 RepID=A0A426Y9W3_ENSVE|nr:hypothetical protein B296_00037230 [Ensete ventricosum]